MQRAVERHLAGARAARAAADRHEALVAERRRRAGRRRPARSRDITSGVAIGRSSVPISLPPTPATPVDADELRVVGPIGERPIPVERLAERGGEALARERELDAARARPAAAASLNAVASVISAIGVMPAIGSFEKLPSEYETAPISRPSM